MSVEIQDEELHELRRIFARLDMDGSGSITIKELEGAFQSLGQTFNREDISHTLSGFDLNQDGFLTFAEFLSLYKKQISSKIKENKLKEAFHVCDGDQSEFINFEELKIVMKQVGEQLSDEELTQILKESDLDGDNKINFNEFVEFMKYR